MRPGALETIVKHFRDFNAFLRKIRPKFDCDFDNLNQQEVNLGINVEEEEL